MNQSQDDLDEFYYGQHSTPDPFVSLGVDNHHHEPKADINGSKAGMDENYADGYGPLDQYSENKFEFVRNHASSSRGTSQGGAGL